MAKKTFTFDNKSSGDFGLFINGRGVFDSPEPDLEYVSIPGRSGDLIYDNKRFNNIELTYPACFTLSNFQSNLKALQAFFLKHKGYFRLEDDYLPDHFRMASVDRAINPEEIVWVYDSGSVDLTFNCKPQLYLKSGETETEYTSDDTVSNPTAFVAKPLISIYGTGSITLAGKTIQVASHAYPYIVIDCDLMDCYYDVHNLNQYVTVSDFPELAPGNNTLVIGSGITNVGITPRWWTV